MRRDDCEASIQTLFIINMLYTLAGRKEKNVLLQATNQAESEQP